MVEDIKLDTFPKEAGVYIFSANDEVIYVGSSKNIYQRMKSHRSCIKQGSTHGYKQNLYQYLQTNPFTVEFQVTDVYRQLEQELVEKYNPKYNSHRAYTGLGTWNGREAEYKKEWYQKYKEEILEQKKQYNKSDKHKESKREYQNQLCFFNGKHITLSALSTRFKRQGLSNPTTEAKKYIIKKETNNPIEFYDIYP